MPPKLGKSFFFFGWVEFHGWIEKQCLAPAWEKKSIDCIDLNKHIKSYPQHVIAVCNI
jgi:hypothetical protein